MRKIRQLGKDYSKDRKGGRSSEESGKRWQGSRRANRNKGNREKQQIVQVPPQLPLGGEKETKDSNTNSPGDRPAFPAAKEAYVSHQS
jgi:hypothetical protein